MAMPWWRSSPVFKFIHESLANFDEIGIENFA
jgi:hypothetical protein